MAESCLLIKVTPGKGKFAWAVLAMMSVVERQRGKAKIEKVTFMYGPYDLAVKLTGKIEQMEKTAFEIRQKLGKPDYITDTLTLICYEPPVPASEWKDLFRQHLSEQRIPELLQHMEDKKQVNWEEFREILDRNRTAARDLLNTLL